MSVTVETETEIARPIEEVFEFVTATENDELWHPRVDESTAPDGEMRVGATWKEISDGMIRTTEVAMECTQYDPPNGFAYRTPVGFFGGRVKTKEAAYTFTAEGDRTRIVWEGTMEIRGVLRLLTPLLGRMVKSDVGTSFETLQTLLEESDERRVKRVKGNTEAVSGQGNPT